MVITLAEHLKVRLKKREISEEIVRKVCLESGERYYDEATGCFIAVKKLVYKGKERDMMVAYDTIKEEEVVLVTIHPLGSGQKEGRIRKGRWKKI
jgi:hypothetical protein